MKILLAFDKFKGSLSAEEVSGFVQEGLEERFAEVECTVCGISDGGEGFTKALVESTGGAMLTEMVEDPLGCMVEAEWGVIPLRGGKKAGVIEMSAASGLWRVKKEDVNIMKASTYGTGQLLRIAAERGDLERVYMGLGGSATNDMGAGMAQALGVEFLGVRGNACPAALKQLTGIEMDGRVDLPPITVACDVDNPLCGERGAAVVFGPQKGANAEQVVVLDELLEHVAAFTPSPELGESPGAGAAGGMGFGMMVFAGAELVSGFDLVADAIGLEAEVAQADIVITGEGGLDEQSLSGKGPLGVALLARKHGKPCYAVAGMIDRDVDWSPYFQGSVALVETGHAVEDLMADTGRYLREVVRELDIGS